MIPGLANGIPWNADASSVFMLRGVRTSRTLDGNVVLVGVAGRTLTLVCGLRPPILLKLEDPVGLAMDAEDEMEEALE
jgi:hypothetical protein